jgi:hypothetical protein
MNFTIPTVAGSVKIDGRCVKVGLTKGFFCDLSPAKLPVPSAQRHRNNGEESSATTGDMNSRGVIIHPLDAFVYSEYVRFVVRD